MWLKVFELKGMFNTIYGVNPKMLKYITSIFDILGKD